MAETTANLLEVVRLGSETAGVLDISTDSLPEPGQYLPCQNLSAHPEVLPTLLFKVMGANNKHLLGPLPESWQPGDRIAYHHPLGTPFQMPVSARRLGLLSFEVTPTRLLPLVETAMKQNAAVSLFCEPRPPIEIINHVPAMVEVSPVSNLIENLNWPDYLAVDLNLEALERLSELLSSPKINLDGQILVRTDMPCHGLAECGVCAVKTQHGWRLACVDGPVFPLKEILRVA